LAPLQPLRKALVAPVASAAPRLPGMQLAVLGLAAQTQMAGRQEGAQTCVGTTLRVTVAQTPCSPFPVGGKERHDYRENERRSPLYGAAICEDTSKSIYCGGLLRLSPNNEKGERR